MKKGDFPRRFCQKQFDRVAVAPDFIGTGDCNRDGAKDIIAAQRGDDKTYLLLGDTKFIQDFVIEYRSRDGDARRQHRSARQRADLLWQSPESAARRWLFTKRADAFGENAEIYPLPAEATSLAIGQLDDADPMDIIAAVGGKIAIIHGSYLKTEIASRRSRNS